MFSVYGKAGRLFRGSMEDLRKIGPTSALSRSRRVAGLGQETLDSFVSHLSLHGNAHPTPAMPAQDAPHRDAMAAYARTASHQPPRHALSLVRDIMNPGAITLSESYTVGQAWGLLIEHQLGQAPVLDLEGRLIGLLTRAELMRADRLPGPQRHALAWQALLAQSVTDLMLTPIPSVAPETDIRRLARVLLDTSLPGLPVVDEQDHVIGFVSRTDILRAVVADPPLDLWT
jgi:CBS domain-containing protein